MKFSKKDQFFYDNIQKNEGKTFINSEMTQKSKNF